MALNSSSGAQRTQQAEEKSSSPLRKLKKAFTHSAKTREKEKTDKKPTIKTKEKSSRMSWSYERHESATSSMASSSSAMTAVMASDTRFPPLASSYATPPAQIDWRSPLSAQSSLTSAGSSTTITITTGHPQFPPTSSYQAAIPTPADVFSYPPIQFPSLASPRPADPAPPLTTAAAQPEPSNAAQGKPIPGKEASASAVSDEIPRVEQTRRLFSLLERTIESLIWNPSPSNYQQLDDVMKKIDTSGLDFTAIDASSLVLRILVNPGEEPLDTLIAWIAQLGCRLVSGARPMGLNRSSVLERAVERGWTQTTNALAARLNQDKALREHTGNMLARAMQADKPISLLNNALRFSSDHCALDGGIIVKMVSILEKHWQSDPDNDLHRAKFVALFEETVRQKQETLPIAALLQVAVKLHHAPMALTMLQLNANTEYLDGDGKTVIDLALEAQQALIEKIDGLRANAKGMDPADYKTKLGQYQTMLRSNQRILDALDDILSTNDKTFSE